MTAKDVHPILPFMVSPLRAEVSNERAPPVAHTSLEEGFAASDTRVRGWLETARARQRCGVHAGSPFWSRWRLPPGCLHTSDRREHRRAGGVAASRWKARAHVGTDA